MRRKMRALLVAGLALVATAAVSVAPALAGDQGGVPPNTFSDIDQPGECAYVKIASTGHYFVVIGTANGQLTIGPISRTNSQGQPQLPAGVDATHCDFRGEF